MKSTLNRLAILISLLAFGSSAWAAKNTLSYPYGLALDSQGNLYVANSGGNNILVFGPGYSLAAAKTITQGISNPRGVAFDPSGNLWVANYGAVNGAPNGSIVEYTNGVQNTANTITDGIQGPGAIAIDGLGNIFVQNDNVNISVYSQTTLYGAPTTLLRTISPAFPLYGIAVGQGTMAWGTNGSTVFWSEVDWLLNTLNLQAGIAGSGFALANDSFGNTWCGTLEKTVEANSPIEGGAMIANFTISFVPYGIAIDSVRGRIYLSDYNDSLIWVYSMKGDLITKFQ